jgi:hypothetical protein
MKLAEKKGQIWNESRAYRDPITLKKVRRITTEGDYSNTMGYHTGIGWSGDGENILLMMGRDGKSALVNCHVPTGDLKQLTDAYDGVTIGSLKGQSAGFYFHKKKAVLFNHIESRTARVVEVDTLEENIVAENLDQIGPLSADEKHFVNIEIGDKKDARERVIYAQLPYTFIQNNMEDGSRKTIYEGEGSGGHLQYSPTNPDHLLFDRNVPLFDYPHNGINARVCLLTISTGKLVELIPRNENHAQWHATWRWDGKYVYCHGYNGLRSNWVRPCQDGWFISIIDTAGTVYREYESTGWMNYGHVGSLGTTDKVLLDGNVTDNMVLALTYDDEKIPRFEMIANHETLWGSNFGQMGHPHTTSDRAGKYIAFNAAEKGGVSADAYVVEL